MSWPDYLPSLVGAEPNKVLSGGAIMMAENGAMCATDPPTFQPYGYWCTNWKQEWLASNGVTLQDGRKFFHIQFDDEKDLWIGRLGAATLCIAKTKTLYVVGYLEKGDTPVCRTQVEKMRDYFVGAGY